MNKKNIIIIAVSGLVVLGLFFYGGMKFGNRNNSVINTKGPFSGQFDLQGLGMQRSGNQDGLLRTGGIGGGVSGEIIAKDDKSITVKLKDGGSKIIFYSEKTLVSKMTTMSIGDVLVGGQVMIIGSAGDDGIISAESIQLK